MKGLLFKIDTIFVDYEKLQPIETGQTDGAGMDYSQ